MIITVYFVAKQGDSRNNTLYKYLPEKVQKTNSPSAWVMCIHVDGNVCVFLCVRAHTGLISRDLEKISK